MDHSHSPTLSPPTRPSSNVTKPLNAPSSVLLRTAQYLDPCIRSRVSSLTRRSPEGSPQCGPTTPRAFLVPSLLIVEARPSRHTSGRCIRKGPDRTPSPHSRSIPLHLRRTQTIHTSVLPNASHPHSHPHTPPVLALIFLFHIGITLGSSSQYPRAVIIRLQHHA